MRAKVGVLIGLMLAFSLFTHGAFAVTVSCDDTAKYNAGSGFWTVECSVNGSEPRLYYKTVVGLRGSSMLAPVGGHKIRVAIYQEEITNFSTDVLFDGALAGIKVPVTVTLYKLNTSSGDFQEIGEKHVVVRLGMSLWGYLYSFIWGLLGLFLLSLAGYTKWDSGKGLVGGLMFIYLVFRGIYVPSLSALLMMPFTTFSVMSNGRSEASALVLSGISALLLFESAYALGVAKSEYPKISFYTGLGWLAGLPLAFSFRWSDYFYPFVLSLLLAAPLMVILWKYAELPYSKCHKALSLFKTYSVPLSAGVALVLALQYTTEETISLLAVFLVSLVIYVFTSRLAFEKLEWAKRKFDEDIERIRGESKTI